MRSFLHDFRHGLRTMAGTPGVSALAVVALALGIGANTAIFSVVNTVLLRGLPVPDPDQLVSFGHFNQRRNITTDGSPYADVCEWRVQLKSFDGISAFLQAPANVAVGDETERVFAARVNWTFFPMLKVRPVLGRDFLSEEDRPGAGRVAILTHELWKRRFGASAGAVGATLNLDGEPHTVVGVLPPRFRFTGQRADVYVPLALSEARGPRPVPVHAYGRLKPGLTREHAQPELDTVTAATRERFPPYKEWQLRVFALTEWIVPDVRTSLWVLLGAVGLVLLIACANVAGLLLSQAATRRREIAVRAALGAGRGRLVRQLFGESTPLGVLGGALGLLLAWWAVRLLQSYDLPRIPRLNETELDGTVLAFTMGVSLLTCVLFGLAPALSASRADVHEALKDGARGGGAGLRGSRMRSVLVVAEVALALLLAVGATLMIRTFNSLSAVNPGFNPEGVLAASIDLPRSRPWTPELLVAWYRQVTDQLQTIPGVKAVALTNSLPLGGNYFRGDFQVEGEEHGTGKPLMLDFRTVDANYFRTLEIPLRRGRFFTEQDGQGAPPVVVLSEATARRLFAGRDPIGLRLLHGKEPMTVVGVVGDVKHTDIGMDPASEVLLPFAQRPGPGATLIVRPDSRTYPDPMRFAPLLRQAVASVDRNQAVYGVSSMDRIMAGRLAPRRLNMLLLTAFAGLALVLAAVGIYGVLSFAVERRRHEIGVRMALGALDSDVVSMVVRQALLLAVAGAVIGIGAAVALTRVLQSILYGVSPTDPLALAGAAFVLLGVAALASYVPARRAARVDPVVALRCE